MVPAPVERRQVRGHRQRSQILQHRQWWRSPALAQRCGAAASERSAEFGSVSHVRCGHARARSGAEFQRALRQTDLHRPAGRRCGCWPTSTVLFSGIVVGRSAADAGARAIGAAADVGFTWSRRRRWCRRRSSAGRYGVIGNDRKFCSTDSGGALPRSLSAAELRLRKDQRNLAALAMFAVVTRAREAAPIPARSEADRPAPAGWAALRLHSEHG